MASQAAVKLRHRIEAFLGRGLKIRQVKRVEEFIINFKPWFPLRYLEALTQTMEQFHSGPRNWGIIYYPLYAMGRAFRGYTRRDNFIFIRGRLSRIYIDCDLMGGDGFSEKDLSAVLFLFQECTDDEIKNAFTIARTYGLRTLSHLRGIILKNRARALLGQMKTLALDQDQNLKAKIESWALRKYPEVSSLQALYSHRLRNIARGKSGLKVFSDPFNETDELERGHDRP